MTVGKRVNSQEPDKRSRGEVISLACLVHDGTCHSTLFFKARFRYLPTAANLPEAQLKHPIVIPPAEYVSAGHGRHADPL